MSIIRPDPYYVKDDYEPDVLFLDKNGRERAFSGRIVREELASCRGVQSWHGGTRSEWAYELAELVEAIDSGAHPGAIGALLRVAEQRAFELSMDVLCSDWGWDIATEASYLYEDRDDHEALCDALSDCQRQSSERDVARLVIANGEPLYYEPKYGDWIDIGCTNGGWARVGVYVRTCTGFEREHLGRDLLTGEITNVNNGAIIRPGAGVSALPATRLAAPGATAVPSHRRTLP